MNENISGLQKKLDDSSDLLSSRQNELLSKKSQLDTAVLAANEKSREVDSIKKELESVKEELESTRMDRSTSADALSELRGINAELKEKNVVCLLKPPPHLI